MKDIEIGEVSEKLSFNLSEYVRVLKLTRKPTREEFITIAKVSGAGILLIGIIGFILYILITELPRQMAGKI
ncbi:MAG TPA: protein translocase SEC61 complex subunit gamma [Candidatus Methanoperedenaceae archaeon]|nr:protein translocase SEC61 complex subunit gamma [Candidatus Methanoperedenaceae archaeon]